MSFADRSLVSNEVVNENIRHALDLRMGQGRKYSVRDVAEGILPGSTAEEEIQRCAGRLYSYKEGRATVPGDVLIQLCQFFGPAFTSKILDSTGQGAQYLDPQPGDPGYVIAKLAGGSAEFAARGADHRFCHIDRGHLEPVADEMIQILTPFASREARTSIQEANGE